MNRIQNYGNTSSVRSTIKAILLVLCLSAAALAADSISGTVQNRTKGQAAAGDAVVVLRLDQGMQEEMRTKTDDQGAFTVKVQAPDKPYLIRIIHQGVNYDQPTSAGNSVAINVFDAAAKVQGVTGNIEIIRTGTKQNGLHVSDMIDVRNESVPPVTQAGERTFDVYLPAKAKIDSVMAASSNKMAVVIPAAPVPGQPGHYTVNFPLRPGSTQFAFNYDIPYDGRAVFRPRLTYPVKQLAVMIPPTMTFSSSSTAFHPLNTGTTEYKVQATSQLQAGEAPAFEISGAGAMPSIQARSQARPGTAPASNPGAPTGQSALPSANNSVGQTQAPVERNPQSAQPAPVTPAAAVSPREWWILGAAAALVLGVCGFVIWRTQAKITPGAKVTGSAASPLLEALKQELLDLETSRVQGAISREDYDKAKRALDGSVRRVLARAAAKS
jgi:hypothetical protein